MKNRDNHINNCPLYDTVYLIKNKWVINILKDLFNDKHYFNEFLKANSDLNSHKVLSQTLKRMKENELITSKSVNNGKNIQYDLTEKGKSLNKILYEIAIFTINNEDYSDVMTGYLYKMFNDIFKI